MSLLICSEIQHPILHALAGRKEKKLAPPPPRPLPQVGEGVHTGDGQAGSRDASGCPPTFPYPSGGGISCSLSRLRERVRVRVLLPPAHLCSVPSGLLSVPRWGKAGMGAGHGPEYEQVKQQMPGWPPPSPPQRGEGKNHPHPCPLPQVGEGVHTGDGQASSGDALGCPTPSPSGGGKESPSPLPSPTRGRGSACTKEKIPSPVYGRGSG